MKNLRALDNNIRKAITDGKLDGVSDLLDELLRKCDNEQARLQSGSRNVDIAKLHNRKTFKILITMNIPSRWTRPVMP